MEATNFRGVCEIFLRYTRKIHAKSTPTDPNFLAISIACGRIEQFVESVYPSATTKSISKLKLEAEKAEREKNAPTADEQRDLYLLYAGVALVWLVLFVIMAGVAWLFGARFDLIWKDLKAGNILQNLGMANAAGFLGRI